MTTASRMVHSAAIAAALEKEIVTGRLNAGARLDEASLTRRFGVSRTPVREALHILVSRSLAERIPFRGVIVVDITPERVEQMFEAMGEIEALCGRLASERMKISERALLEEHHTRLGTIAAKKDPEGYEVANAEFHQLIYDGAHNADLSEVSNSLRLKLAPFRKSQLQSIERMHRSNEEHSAIVAAILDRDPEGTARALRRHLLSAAREVLRELNDATETADPGQGTYG
ncbi:GntR family transcriptional regulator [Palleronia abyssalis]|uniref:HTH-type transcriptional regulator McbR n=1 Tax=Palleronia abyssalis TaxID=1501240 RepID=A0A2R8BVK6_9RHOB|nr:GntR family transcriptional regulator [Palleronia abyssalis]SPJ24192.1 HTH-type transcriptional regulator McbR [Palleronia abyssalis]